MATRQASAGIEPVDGRFLMRIFYAFVTLAFLSVAITFAGRYLGSSMVMAGNTDDSSLRRITIGEETLAIPANMIRFADARREGAADRLDLYVHWPDMEGYSPDDRDDFDGRSDAKRILFFTILPREMSRDMSGRFAPIYSNLIQMPGTPGSAGIVQYRFLPNSGYMDEELAVAPRDGESTPFVARCLDPAASAEAFAGCERDIQFGNDLELRYRFPRELLGDWKALDAAVGQFARTHLVKSQPTAPAS
jgi:hypothetical protein